MAHSAHITEVSAAEVTQRNMRAEIEQAAKTYQQRLWERGEEEALLKFGHAHLSRSPHVENRVLKSSDATKVRKVVRKGGDLWTTGDDGVWRKA